MEPGHEPRVEQDTPRHHLHPDAEALERDFVEPVVEALQIEPDTVVVDLNAGTDRFALSIASRLKSLGGHGIVFAFDHDDQMVELLHERITATDPDLPVTALPLSQYGPATVPFHDECADRVLAVNCAVDGSNGLRLLDEIYRVLKPGGAVLLVRWQPDGVLQTGRIDELNRDFEQLDAGLAWAGFTECKTLLLSWEFLALRAVKPLPLPDAQSDEEE